MEEVRVVEKRLSDYRAIIGGPAFAEILAMASKLKGKRVAHVNATGYGGGGRGRAHTRPPPPRGGGPRGCRGFLPRGGGCFPAREEDGHTPPGPRAGLRAGDEGSSPR